MKFLFYFFIFYVLFRVIGTVMRMTANKKKYFEHKQQTTKPVEKKEVDNNDYIDYEEV